MITTNAEISKDLEKALQELEQAKQRVANAKKKQNEKRRKAQRGIPHMAKLTRTKTKGRTIVMTGIRKVKIRGDLITPFVRLSEADT